MRRRTLIGAGMGALTLAGPAQGRARGRSLFDSRTLRGWRAVGDANWAVADGALRADQGVGFLVSEAAFSDVEITVEAWLSPEANSGVFIRCADPAAITPDTSYEVNLFDRRPDPTYASGAIVGVASAARVMTTGGRWNTLQILARGPRLTVTLNGVRTVDEVIDARHAAGPIALQRAAGEVRFRSVRVRPLRG